MARRNNAFTLIELLVVIAIIGILSGIVLATVNTVRTKAQIAKTKQELAQFSRAIVIAQGEAGKTLIGITGNNCSDCACRTGASIKNDVGGCYTNWTNVLTTVQTATNGLVSGLNRMTRDVWGSPYLVDENEGEGGPSDCRNDALFSAGPDGIDGNSDDISVIVPLYKYPCP